MFSNRNGACLEYIEFFLNKLPRKAPLLEQPLCFEICFIPAVCRLDYNVLSNFVADLFSHECYDKAGAQETIWKVQNLNQDEL